MSLYKRGKTWHTDFTANGQRYRQSLDTTDWREAQSKQKKLIADAEAGKLSATKQQFSRLKFREAAQQFLEDRKPRLAVLSVRTETERAKVLNQEFGEIQVRHITPDDILAHIRKRKAQGISNATVNRELDILRGVLKKAKRWHLFSDDITPLPLRQTLGRALAPEEKYRLLKIAASRDEWQTAYYAALLALIPLCVGARSKVYAGAM